MNDRNFRFIPRLTLWTTVGAHLLAAVGVVTLTPQVRAQVPEGQARADHNCLTGTILVSVNRVTSWYVESRSHSLTGAAAAPFLGPGFITDTDHRIGENRLSHFSYVVELKNVAAPNLHCSDLTVFWHPDLGRPRQSAPVCFAVPSKCVPEPSGSILATIGLLSVASIYRRTTCRKP